MSWITAALVAPLLWSFTNLLHSKLRKEQIQNSITLTIFTGILSLLAFVVAPFTGFGLLSLKGIIFALLSGGIYVYASIPYFKALSQEEASRVVTLWHLAKAWMPLLAFVFLREKLSNWEFIAFCMIIVGAMVISTRKEKKKFKISTALYWAVLAGLMYQVYYLLQKPLYADFNFWEAFLWIKIGNFLGALTLMIIPVYGRDFFVTLKSLKAKTTAMIFSAESLNVLGTVFIGYALVQGSVSLVLALTGFQAVYIFVISGLLSLFAPKIYREEMGAGALLAKVIAIILMVGSLLILKLL